MEREMNDICNLEWCISEAQPNKYFCRYHQDKLDPAMKPLKRSVYTSQEAFNRAVTFLTAEHETMVDCPKCKGRRVNMGHSSYLRGKTCSWCKSGKRAKIY
jgi:hypothetical protein